MSSPTRRLAKVQDLLKTGDLYDLIKFGMRAKDAQFTNLDRYIQQALMKSQQNENWQQELSRLECESQADIET